MQRFFNCPQCGQYIQQSQTRCHYCNMTFSWGTPPIPLPPPLFSKEWWVHSPSAKAFALVLIAIIAIGFYLVNAHNKDLAMQAAWAARPVINISATALASEYKANEVAANLKYETRTLYINGIITAIGSGFTNDPYIVLEDDVQCVFPASAAGQIAILSKGQKVDVQGRCSGKILINVMLSDCVLK